MHFDREKETVRARRGRRPTGWKFESTQNAAKLEFELWATGSDIHVKGPVSTCDTPYCPNLDTVFNESAMLWRDDRDWTPNTEPSTYRPFTGPMKVRDRMTRRVLAHCTP